MSVDDPRFCGLWDSWSGRYCRNKPYSVRVMYDGRELPGLCRKHTRQEIEQFERDNRQLAFYLRYRHLLHGDIQPATEDAGCRAVRRTSSDAKP